MEGGCKWRCKSLRLAGSEGFSFPFESPPGGCVIKYVFHVHDGSSVAFSVRYNHAEAFSTHGDACEGVVKLADGGMGAIRWDAASRLFSFDLTLTYEVILLPLAHLAALERRQMCHYAATGEVAKTLSLVGRHGMEGTDEEGRSVLHSAAGAGQLALLTALLPRVEGQSHALEMRAANGRTPLLEACARGEGEAVRMLLDSGASATPLDSRGRSCLHCLCEWAGGESEGVVLTATLLLQHLSSSGAKLLPSLLAGVDASGASPLAAAAAAGNLRCCQLMLDAGAAASEAVEGEEKKRVPTLLPLVLPHMRSIPSLVSPPSFAQYLPLALTPLPSISTCRGS